MQGIIAPESIQEGEYAFPYHHVPRWDGAHFSAVRYWSWSFRYLGGIALVLDLLDGEPIPSLLDVGCGDGRFLGFARARWPEAELLGIDRSSQAIDLARVLSPGVRFECGDVASIEPERRFRDATLIEVLEHVPPQEASGLLEEVATRLEPGGRLIVTVPHANQPVLDKHYQHFTAASLAATVPPGLEMVSLAPFDARSRVLSLLHRMLGGHGRFAVVTHEGLNERFFRYYLKRHLTGVPESRCTRLAMVCRRR